MFKKTVVLLFMVLGFAFGEPLYHCPMHPTYTSDQAGDCPICHMKLVLIRKPAAPAGGTGSTIPGYADVQMTDAQVQLIGVKTTRVAFGHIPLTAVMDTGRRKIVFVEEKPGHYLPRQIETGKENGDLVEVRSGLKGGERVVVSANFLIDSESRIKGALQ